MSVLYPQKRSTPMTVKHSDGQKMSNFKPVFTGVAVSECSRSLTERRENRNGRSLPHYRLECCMSFVEVVFLGWKQLRKHHSV